MPFFQRAILLITCTQTFSAYSVRSLRSYVTNCNPGQGVNMSKLSQHTCVLV